LTPFRSSAGGHRGHKAQARGGRQLRSLPLRPGDRDAVIDLPATLCARLLRGGGNLRFADLRRRQFQSRGKALVVFVLDASESMGEGSLERMKAAKGAILGLLTAAYQSRDQVALISCREQQAEVLLRPTSSVLLARQRLQRLPLGGATPLADGLRRASQLIATERRRQPQLQPLMVLVSDGEANVPLKPGADVQAELIELGRQLRKEQVDSLVIDSRLGVFGSELLRELAQATGGSYRHVRELHAGKLLAAIRGLEAGK